VTSVTETDAVAEESAGDEKTPSGGGILAGIVGLLVLLAAGWLLGGFGGASPVSETVAQATQAGGKDPVQGSASTSESAPTGSVVDGGGPLTVDAGTHQVDAGKKVSAQPVKKRRRRLRKKPTKSPPKASSAERKPVAVAPRIVASKPKEKIVRMRRADFDAVLIDRLPKLQRCKKTHGSIKGGMIDVSVWVGGKGRTTKVTARGADGAYSQCLRAEIKRWRFVKRGGDPERFDFPF